MGATRLDQFLVDKGLARSRTQSQDLIKSGAVSVNQIVQTKPSYKVDADDTVELHQSEITKFVSRAGLKLEGALENTNIGVLDKTCLDVGQSTGGFTDCLLKRGAKTVVGLDVGTQQIDNSLRNQPNVTVLERVNIKDVSPQELKKYNKEQGFDLVVVDVSFISLTQVLDQVVKLLSDSGDLLALVKPQFEVGKSGLNKSGVVKDESLYEDVRQKVENKIRSLELNLESYFESLIKGRNGNKEFFVHARFANTGDRLPDRT